MITQQVVTYIKDQLARGMAREKIRSNLLSAGWVETDIQQAFSFAEPNTPSAALKIAPAFAVPDEVRVEKPVDKTEITKTVEPMMPILKRDNPVTADTNLSNFGSGSLVQNEIISPVQEKPIGSILNIEKKVETPLNPAPVVMPTASSLVQDSKVNLGNISTMQADIVRSFDPTPNIPVKSSGSSSFLKIIAVILALVLVIGNVYIWLVVFPNMNNTATFPESNIQDSNQQINREFSPTLEEEANLNFITSSPAEDMLIPATDLQAKAAIYFSKYNSYGGASMPLGSCNASGTVFSDIAVKSALENLGSVSGRVPQCALVGDGNPTGQIRTVAYIVYIPMEDAGYCVDSTGAAIVVSKIPNGLSCASGL